MRYVTDEGIGGKNLLYTVIKKNLYQDSVNLMLLTNYLSEMDNINQVSIMMGTPANKDIFKGSGLYTAELDTANPNDLCIVADASDKEMVDQLILEVDSFLANQSSTSKEKSISVVRTWEMAENKLPNADLAVISIAGEYAASEANKALDRNLHVFLFSDNVSLDDELQLKRRAEEKGLLVMGPDCGTGIFSGVPIAFANVIEEGNIGVVGASGTGIQEVTSIIGRLGGGISHAIGTGGRDLSAEIGGITTIRGLQMLNADPETDVIVFISKPPAPEIREKVIEEFKKLHKPVVAVFMGDRPQKQHDNVYYTWTLRDTALKALELAEKNQTTADQLVADHKELRDMKKNPEQLHVKGFYCGGTLALEAAMILREAFDLHAVNEHPEGIMLDDQGFEVIDFGDDAYTKGRAHPMIDPTYRMEKVKEAAADPKTAIILLDNVIGYGAHDNVAGILAPVIQKAKAERNIIFITSVTGTGLDPQVYEDQVKKLKESGAIVADSNAQATALAVEIVNYLIGEERPAANKDESREGTITNLISAKPNVINIGLSSFAEAIEKHGGQVVQYQWAPIAGGNKHFAKILELLK